MLGLIGSGGMGTVYRAQLLGQAGFSKTVAIKVPNERGRGELEIRRFRDEARLLGLLSHRAIVGVHGLVQLDGDWTVVMDYVDGVDLKTLLSQHGPLPVGVALEVVAELSAALHVAYHTKGPDDRLLRLQHRDVKPGNILFTAAGEVKILDFGIARANFAEREAQTLDVTFGTAAYMSPERLDSLDHVASDIYSLGAVFYEMLLGEPLGRTSAHIGRHKQRRETAMQNLAHHGPDVAELFGKMVLYKPHLRPVARDVERSCHRLRARAGAPSLRDWAESTIPGLLQQRRVEVADDSLTGRILVEATSSSVLLPDPEEEPEDVEELRDAVEVDPEFGLSLEPATPTPPPVRHIDDLELDEPLAGPAPEPAWPLPLVAAGGLALALGSLVVLVLAARVVLQQPQAAAPTEAAAPRRAVKVLEPRPGEGTAVVLSGDVESALLVDGPARYAVPGPVPPGSYEVLAAFGEGEPTPAGRVTVGTEPLRVACDAATASCAVPR